MTIAEILKAKGIDDAVINEIQEEMKSNKIFTASEENLDVRYGKLKTEHEGKLAELAEANNLIAEFKKNSKGNEGLQQKINDFEAQMAKLQEENAKIKLESAIKVELLKAKALDVDYLTFKLKEKGELALDESEQIKGWEDKLAALKTQFPTQFEGSGSKKYEEHKLPDEPGGSNTVTKESFDKMGYQDRLKLFNENPEAYAELSKK